MGYSGVRVGIKISIKLVLNKPNQFFHYSNFGIYIFSESWIKIPAISTVVKKGTQFTQFGQKIELQSVCKHD